MEIGFSSYSGGDFLLFYVLLLAATVAASLWMPGRLRPKGRVVELANPELLAYLGGGPARFADSVLAALVARGALLVEKKELVPTGSEEGETRAESALLREHGTLSWKQVQKTLVPLVDAAERELVSRGLLTAPDERLKLRLLPVLPFVALFLIGLFRRQAGAAEGEPVGFLTVLLVVTVVFAIIRLSRFNPRTHGGDEALERARDAAARLRSAPTNSEAGLAVGLFGTAILVGTPFDSLHAMRQPQSGDAGGGADGDGDGGSGCGGGGCGGCGG